MTISPSSTFAPPSLERRTSALKGEIVEIWSQVQARVIQLAGGDSSKVQGTLDINGVLTCLDGVHQQSENGEGSVREIFNKTLQFIDTVGGIVANGASGVFGPSELCFNALSLVIQAWQGYQGVFESLAGLLERCGQYLVRLEYYIRGGLDVKLAKVACQHLQLFVEICDRVIKLRNSKRLKFMVFTKILFLNDNDINDLLGKMEGLVDEEGRLVIAQTFSFASEVVISTRENLAIARAVNSKIDMLIANRSDQLKDSDTKRRKENILRTLAFDANKLDQNKEPDPYWQRTYQNYRKFVIPGTGKWIFSEPEFEGWEKGREGSPPVLALEGTEGTGKSYLASTIIRHLRSQKAGEDSDSRSLLAFYFVEGDSKEELKRSNHLDVISKSLIWQFAQGDASYLKSVANICERTGDMDPHEIPHQLMFENKDLGGTIDATFFIVIDGLSDIVGDALVKFLQTATRVAAEHRKIRILLTGYPRAIEQLSTNKDIAFRMIPINERNRSDIAMYTQSRMDRIEALKDTTRLGVSELREKICESLCDKTAGDYFRVNTILKQINTLDYVHDIDQVLENAGRERSQQIQSEIERLNNTRTPKEIAEINEIILWVCYGREWFKPKQISAVLYTKSGELSLLTLESKLQIKYFLFEVDSDGDVDFRSDEIEELIPQRGRPSSEKIDHDRKSILPEEVSIIRHFLKTVCPQSLYEKFDFESVFEQKLRHTHDYICRDDKNTAQVKLAVTCLRILTEKRDERREILRPYAVNHFLDHLSSADLSLVDRKWKSAVGPLLLNLFTNREATDALLWTDNEGDARNFAWVARCSWLDGDKGISEVIRWLKDTAVISDISDQTAQAWIARIASSPSPEKELLPPLAIRMAENWLRKPTKQSLVTYAFCFLFGAMLKIESNDPAEHNALDTAASRTVQEICQVEKWAFTLLNCSADSLWEVQMAIIFDNFLFKNEAEKRCRRSLELDPTNWRASYNLARVVTSSQEAIEILKTVTERLGLDGEWMMDLSHQVVFAEMLFDLGQRYWEAEQYDNAIGSYTKSVKANYTGFKQALLIIVQYYERRLWADILALLQTIQTDSEENLPKMLVELASQDSFHHILQQTATETKKSEFLDNIYDKAIKMSNQNRDFTNLYYLRYQYADVILHKDNGEERAIKLWEVALKEDLPQSFLDVESILPDLIVKLAPIYLRRALAAKRDSEVAQKYLQRISSIFPKDASESNIILPAKLYLARYYQVIGNEMKAKQFVRSTVKVALEMLSDGDDSNDYLAYWRLLLVFLPLNDDINAMAAVSMAALASQSSFARSSSGIPQPEEPRRKRRRRRSSRKDESPKEGSKEKKEQAGKVVRGGRAFLTSQVDGGVTDTSDSEVLDTGDGSESQVFAICDGGCGFCWNTASEMWWCKDCINLTFEKTCFDKLQNGKLPSKLCDKQHEFLIVPEWDDARTKSIPKGSVPYGEDVISTEEWKKVIAKKYVDLET